MRGVNNQSGSADAGQEARVRSEHRSSRLGLWGPAHSGLLLCLALTGLALNLGATRFGPGMTSDSMSYLAAADTWLMGLGLGRLSGPDGFKPLTHFPPLFPLLIAGGRVLGATGIQAARWINALFHGGIVLLGGLTVGHLSASALASLFAGGILLLSPVLLEVDSQAMSEPGYLFLGFLGLWFLWRWQKDGGWWRLAAAGVCIGLACLARYMGQSLVMTALACLVLARGKTVRAKVTEAAAFLLISLPPILAWMMYNVALTGGAANRRWLWHPPPLSYYGSGLRTVWGWLSPVSLGSQRWNAYGGLVLIAAVMAVIWWVVWRARRREPEAFSRIALELVRHPVVLFIPICLGTLVLSRFFLDAITPLDDRNVSPVYLALAILLASLLPLLWKALSDKPAVRVLLCLILMGFLASYGTRVALETGEPVARQRGFLASLWRRGPLREVWDLPQETVIYTDNLENLYYLYGRGGYQVQHAIDVVTGLPRPAYETQVEEVRRALASGEAVLLLLKPESEAASVFLEITDGLDPIVSTEDGTLYMGPYDVGS